MRTAGPGRLTATRALARKGSSFHQWLRVPGSYCPTAVKVRLACPVVTRSLDREVVPAEACRSRSLLTRSHLRAKSRIVAGSSDGQDRVARVGYEGGHRSVRGEGNAPKPIERDRVERPDLNKLESCQREELPSLGRRVLANVPPPRGIGVEEVLESRIQRMPSNHIDSLAEVDGVRHDHDTYRAGP